MMYIQLATFIYGSLLGSFCGRLLCTTAFSFYSALALTLLRMALFIGSIVFLLHWLHINPILFVIAYVLSFWVRIQRKANVT